MVEDEIYNENLVDDPDDLERIIEEDNTERGNTLDNSDNDAEEGNGDDEKENGEEKKKVEPKRKRTLNPQPRLNADRLKGPRGIGILESFFEDIKLKGKGHEKEDLDVVMGRLQHWVHRLFPRFKFDDCLDKIEKLGRKKPIQNHLKRIRLGMEDEVELMSTEQTEEPPSSPPMVDPFDELIGHRPSQASTQPVNLNTEQRERMLRNRMIAEERRMARMKAQHEKQRLQNESSAFPEALTLMKEHSSSYLDNKRNGLDVQVDEDLRGSKQVNTNFDGTQNKQINIPMLEDRDQSTTSSQIKDAELNNTDILPVKESEDLYSDQTSLEDATCTFVNDQDNEKSLIERMLRNKRRAEELRKAKFGKYSQKQELHLEAISISNKINEETEQENNIYQKTLQHEIMDRGIESLEAMNGENFYEQKKQDHKTNYTIQHSVETSNESTVGAQNLHHETMNTSIENLEERIDAKINKQVLGRERNDTNTKKPEEVSGENVIYEPKLHNKTMTTSIESSEREKSKNIIQNQKLDHKENDVIIENPEITSGENIVHDEKFHHETIDTNIQNPEEKNGENHLEKILDHEVNGTHIENPDGTSCENIIVEQILYKETSDESIEMDGNIDHKQILDHEANGTSNENPEVIDDGTIDEQKFHYEKINATKIDNSEEKKGENILEQILDHKSNDTNTENPEELNGDKTVEEQKLDHDMKKTIIEDPVETCNVNNIDEQKLHHETMDISIVNVEAAADKYIIEGQKTQSELRNTNSKNEEDSLAMEIDETF